MAVEDKKWFLIIKGDSELPKNGGAYKLITIKKLGEMKMLPF